MKVVLGTPLFAVPKPWHHFPVPAIMVNAYDMLVKNAPNRNTCTIHELLQCDISQEIWIDSGGYQFLRHGIEPPFDKIVEKVYKRFSEAKYFLNIDYPPSPQDDEHSVKKKLEKTLQNFLKLREVVGDKAVPVLHYHHRVGIVKQFLKIYLDYSPEIIAVGALVPYILILKGVRGNSRLKALLFLRELIEELPRGCKVHVLGLGSPVATAILEQIGVYSTDSSTWRVKAAYGKLILPGGGEVHVTNRNIRFGKRKASGKDLEMIRQFLLKTGFPLVDSFDRVFTSFEYRALVNAYVVMHSREPPRSPTFRKIYEQVVLCRSERTY